MQCIAMSLISGSIWLICCGRTWAITTPGASPAANRQSTSTAQPPSPATPPDAPFPDRGTIPEQSQGSRVKRAIKAVTPNCLDWLLHTCWSQPATAGKNASEVNNPAFAHDMEVGSFNFKQKNYRGAELRFRSALDAIPDEPEATFKLAKTLEKQGRYAEARVQYKKFLRHSKGGPFEDEARTALKGVEGKAHRHH
jgi:hypothetical protein